MKKIFGLLLLLSFNNYAFDDGIDYTILKKPIATTNTDTVEVKELFWYSCPHCFSIEPSLNKWLKTVDTKTVDFVQQPAVFSKRWVNGAIFFYTLKKLNLLNLHSALFEAIHTHKKRFSSINDFSEWVETTSGKKVNQAAIKKVMLSFSVKTQVRKAQKQSLDYKVSGVPSFVINGKYTTSVSQAGNEKKLFKLINFLIKKEQKLLPKNTTK